MASDFIFNSGLVLCAVAVIGAVIAVIVLRVYKMRLRRKLDAEYGKRWH